MKIKALLSVLLLSSIFTLSLSAQCSITNLVATAQDCDINGNVTIDYEFDIEDPGAENMFELFIDGTYRGEYEYGEPSYSYSLLDGNCETIHSVSISDSNDSDCSADFTFDEAFCCYEEGCNMVLDVDFVGECNTQGEFYINLLVANPGGSSGGFETIINGVSFGWIDYGATLYEYGPLDGDCETIYEITVTDFEDATCTLTTTLNNPVCCISDCTISDITVEVIECTTDNNFSIELDFNYAEVEEDNFDFWANGSYHGTYAYADLPLLIDDYPSNSNDDPFVTVFGIGADSQCADDLVFEGLDCNDGICAITNIFAEAYDCNEQGQIFVDIEFDVVNPGPSNQFTINGNGTVYGTFSYGQTFYTVGPFTPDCDLEYEFQILDVDNSDCFEYYVFDDPLCCDVGQCEMTTLDFGANPACVDGLIVTEWLIDGENLSEVGFDIYINDMFETFVTWNEDAIYDFDIEGPETELFTIKVCDNDNNDCCIEWELENPCYETDMEECSINNLEAEATECNDNGEIYFDIFFDVTNPGADNQFTVVGNGNNYGTFEYGEDSYTVGPFIADCETEVELIVNDVNNDCSAFIEFDEIFCCEEEDCSVVELTVLTTDCDEGTDIEVNFDIIGGSGDIFITLNNEIYGPYTDALSPISFVSFLLDPEYITVTVCDAEYPDCCATVEVLNPCYESDPQECSITGIEAEALCTDVGLFADVWFTNDNPGSSNQFDIDVNGQEFGPFEYGETSYTVGPLEIPCDQAQFINVTDVDNDDCTGFFNLELLEGFCCDESNCTITGLGAEATECNDNGEIYFDIFFDVTNPGADNQFIVVGNGNNYGTFEYGESSYNIGPFIADCVNAVELIVTDVNNNDCSGFVDFDEIFCCDEGDCDITTLDFGLNPECVDGLIVAEWLIGGDNLSEVGFDIYINNVFETFVDFNETNWYDFDIEAPDTEFFTIKVCDNDNEDCCIEWELENPCYEEDPEECVISQVTAELIECDENGEAFFNISFNYDNVGDDNSFTINGNGVNYGIFEYGLDFYSVGPVIADCETELEFVITDVNNDDCSAFVEHDPACCEEESDCALFGLSVDASECQDDNTFNLDIDVEVVGEIDDFFDLNIEGDFIGFYAFDDLPIVIDDLSYDAEILNVEVCENDNPDCCISIDIENPCAEKGNQQLFINNIEVEFVSCQDDMITMSVDLDYGDNDDQFSVSAGGIQYGTYSYIDLPILVENIPADGTTDYTFTLEDTSIDNLIASIDVGTLLCDGNIILDIDDYQLGPDKIKSIKVFDITGKYFGEYSYEESQKILDLDRSVSSGILILRIETSTEVYTKKIVRVN